MTPSRDPDRLIHAYLLEGAEYLQDQVYDEVRAAIEHKRQRAFFGPWRTPIMNGNIVRFGVAAVALVAIVLIGSRFLGSPSNLGPGNPTPTPEASVARPSPSGDGSLPEGSRRLWDAQGANGEITVTISAPGWYGEPDSGVLVKNENSDAPDGAGLIVFAETNQLFAGQGDTYVYGDPCQWASTKPATPATSVDEVIAALSTQASRDASTPMDVMVGGHAGKLITLHVPDDARFGDCDQGEFRTLIEGPDGARYAQDPGQIDKLWVLDADGELVIIDAAYYEGTPQNILDEMDAIVESARLNFQ